MNIRDPEATIDPANPFKDDILERGKFADGLASFLERTEGPLTMALTGSFGAGKTYFLTRCRELFAQRGIPTVLVNAWETDFASEPLAPLITELAAKFAKRLKPSDRRWKNAKKHAAKIFAASVPVAVKVASAGILKASDLGIGSAVSDAAEKFAEKQFENFAAAKKSVDGLKKELTRLTEQIRGASPDIEDASMKPIPPVLVIVDELDRCRSSYAIELLEVLKHFFSIPGIVFALGIDRDQIVSAAKAVFGAGLDADGYLRRFIDIECSLPLPNMQQFFLQRASAHRIFRSSEGSVIMEPLSRLCERAGFSLRKTDQILKRIVVASAAASHALGAPPPDCALLVFLREANPVLYRDFVAGKRSAWDVFLYLTQLDPELRNPDQRGLQSAVHFLIFLGSVGNKDTPLNFLDQLAKDSPHEDSKVFFNQLKNWISTISRSHLVRLASCVDFSLAFKFPTE